MIKKHLILSFITALVFSNATFAQQTKTVELFFSSNSSDLSSEEQLKLDNYIKSLDSFNITKINIFAYCDDTGNKSYNQNLSEKRAQKVKAALKARNIKTETFKKVVGKGQLAIQEPDKDLDKQRAYNRRTEILAEYKSKRITVKKEILSDTQKVGDKISFESILFGGGSHQFLPESEETLKNLVATLKEKKQYNIAILGHICCMSPGKDGVDNATGIFNLSEMRAKEVYNYLIQNGIQSKRLSYKGLKSDYPTGKGDKADRRVEIEITSISNK